ncbi:MAG: FAD-dependent monooxygenase [Burkholderiaceae bacterium]|jgi:salicylate hydroxylase|nr:FAD-dependent monooxygenase [Burkholderiaceae bacterium]
MHSTPSTQPIRAAIVGGGIGGLFAANALRARGIDVTVYEQAKVLGEVGAGIVLFPNGVRQLKRMGFNDALDSIGAKYGPDSQYCRMDGTKVGSVQITDSSGSHCTYGVHRADLLGIFAAALPQGVVRTDHRCTGFEQDGASTRLTFANGHHAQADVVIAADGIHSELRRFVVMPQKPEYSGMRAFRGLVAREKLSHWRDHAHQVWMGDGKHFMAYPVRAGALLNYVGFVPAVETIESWSAVGDRNQLLASFRDWNPSVTRLLEQVDTCFWWGLYDRRPLAAWTNGRLALLGDAAHAMLPHLGQGVNQAIEDGIALALLLETCGVAGIPDALTRYAKLRQARTDVVQAEARKNGLRYDSQYVNLELRDREIADNAQLRKWIYDYDVEQAALAERSSSGH